MIICIKHQPLAAAEAWKKSDFSFIKCNSGFIALIYSASQITITQYFLFKILHSELGSIDILHPHPNNKIVFIRRQAESCLFVIIKIVRDFFFTD